MRYEVMSHGRRPHVIVYVHGSTAYNVHEGRVKAGCGYFFGRYHPMNGSCVFAGASQTSKGAELVAIIQALRLIKSTSTFRCVEIRTISEYAARIALQLRYIWQENGWLDSRGGPVADRVIIEEMFKEIDYFDLVRFFTVNDDGRYHAPRVEAARVLAIQAVLSIPVNIAYRKAYVPDDLTKVPDEALPSSSRRAEILGGEDGA